MDRDDIISMALKAGARAWQHKNADVQYLFGIEEIERLLAAEREACAKVCDRFQERDVGMQPAECAGAIRARGQA